MKTFSAFVLAIFVLTLVAGCNRTEGPQEITSASSVRGVQETPPADVVPVDKEPGLVKTAAPEYPEEAMKNGIEGTVYVKIWVDTEGKVRDAVIAKSDNELFDKASISAAMQFRFTPAMKDGNPVSVWVVVPIKYKLADKETGK
jgi:protein TonB